MTAISKTTSRYSYLPHQKELGELLYQKAAEYGFAILAAEERTGKTGTFLYAIEKSQAESALILTKKAAIEGIKEQIEAFGCKKRYEVINYQSLHKIKNLDPDVIVLDEFHQALCSYPKPSQTQRAVKNLAKDRIVIYVSATPFAESYSQCYHALDICSYSPFRKFKNFYQWFKVFGIPVEMRLHGRTIKQYHQTKENKIRSILAPYIVRITRKEIGFAHEPEDVIHHIELDEITKTRIHLLRRHRLLLLEDGSEYVADNTMALMNGEYMLTGGGLLIDEAYKPLSREKIDYIFEHFGDTEGIAIMAHFKGEQERLKKIFKKAHIFSSTSDAEGVDLSSFDKLIVYSMSYSTSKYVQRRCRQCNINRKDPIEVHYLLTDYIDKEVYNQVAVKKQNFTKRVYERVATAKEDTTLSQPA